MKLKGMRTLPNGNVMTLGIEYDASGFKIVRAEFAYGSNITIKIKASTLPETSKMVAGEYNFTTIANEVEAYINTTECMNILT